jgi:hypothetical protein
MAGPPSTAHPSTLTSPPDPDHHAVPDPRHANFHHLRDTTPGLRYQLSPETSLFADYQHRWQYSDDENAEYTENRVAVGVRLSR